MATWVSITTTTALVARQFERDLRLALCMERDLQIVSFQFDTAVADVAPSQIGKSFEAFLARQSGLVGVISYEIEALKLIEFAPAHLVQVFALAEISGWHSPQPMTARAGIVGDLLARKSFAGRISICAPQTRALASIAKAMFPGKIVDAPIPFAAAGEFAALDEGLSLGAPPDLGPEGWEIFAVLVKTLSLKAEENNAPAPRIYAPADFFSSPHSWLVREIPGVLVIEGMSPDNRSYAGGDFLVATAADVHQLDVIARDAAVAGAALLILDGDATDRRIELLDAAGAPVSMAKLATDPDFRSELRGAFNERVARIADQSKRFWQSLMLDGRASGPEDRFESIVDNAIYTAVAEREELAEERAASRAFLTSPASEQSVLNLAGALARTDLAASWPLVALANRVARGTESTPLRPPALDAGGGRLFVTDDRGPLQSPEQRRALQYWLDDLPAGGRESGVRHGRAAPFPNAPLGDGAVSYSVGLNRDAEGQREINSVGALLWLNIGDASKVDDSVVAMEFSLFGEQPVGRIEVEVNHNGPRRIDLTSNALRRVQIPVGPLDDSAPWIEVKLTPIELTWARILLTDIGLESAGQQVQTNPEALESVGFDLLQTPSVTSSAISGAFGVEQDADGHDFRWISRELILKLPQEPPTSRGDEPGSEGWLVLKLRPTPSSHQIPLAADIDLPGANGNAATTAMRRLGGLQDDVLLGAPIGVLQGGGIARITLRRPNSPLSSMDSRLAAACLTGLWIASPRAARTQASAQRLVRLNVENGAQFTGGWHGLETVKGLTSRWMARDGLLSSGVRPRADSRIFLALGGPWLPKDNPALVPFTVKFDGRPMLEYARVESKEGWALLFEGETRGDAFVAEFELTAEAVRVLGPADPREASILASFAALVDPDGDASPTNAVFGDAEVMNGTLQVEHWGGGLSGAWLPPATIMLCVRSVGTDHLVIHGAAATDTATVEGMAVEVDGDFVKSSWDVAKDGSWTLRAALGNARAGAALLLRLTAPGSGRVMLHRVGFE